MSRSIRIGTAMAVPGSIQYGYWEALGHPTGHIEFLPVIIAQGKEAGPCFWLTAGIHGPEHSGPLVIYQLINEELVGKLKGTIVAIPALNPAGLRTSQRAPYHVGKDPNRLWPDGKGSKTPDPDQIPPTSLETAYQSLFEDILASADYLIDYHNSRIGSLSFVFRDRVLYRSDGDVEANKTKAQALAGRQDEMIQAYGHTVINEYPAAKYIDDNLHRSTSGAALLLGEIPSFTVELGTGLVPDPAYITASLAGTRNVLRWAGMLDGDMEEITGIKILEMDFPVRRRGTPRVKEPCVAMHLVEAGDIVKSGDPIAKISDVWGRPIGEGVLYAEMDGFVIGRMHGIYYYPGDAVLYMGIRDEQSMVGPYPEDFFE